MRPGPSDKQIAIAISNCVFSYVLMSSNASGYIWDAAHQSCHAVSALLHAQKGIGRCTGGYRCTQSRILLDPLDLHKQHCNAP